jgi:hypothetical protein
MPLMATSDTKKGRSASRLRRIEEALAFAQTAQN